MSILIIGTETFSVPFFVIYSYCGLSDMADGFFARKYNTESQFGEKIDSLADIVFVSSMMVKTIRNIYMGYCYCYNKFFWYCVWFYLLQKNNMFAHNGEKITGFALFLAPFLMANISSVIIYASLCALATFAAVEEC